MPKFHDDGQLAIRRDPTAAELIGLRHRAAFDDLRAILDDDGSLYVWDGNAATHADIAADIGLDGLRLEILPDRVLVVLAGGALEMLDGHEKIETFFARHGHPGATLADRRVLTEIADRSTARVLAAPAVRRALPDIDRIEADIDPRIDWAAQVIAMAERAAGVGNHQTMADAPGMAA